jgi:hypothetical protein
LLEGETVLCGGAAFDGEFPWGGPFGPEGIGVAVADAGEATSVRE